jgi:hypothetical protein
MIFNTKLSSQFSRYVYKSTHKRLDGRPVGWNSALVRCSVTGALWENPWLLAERWLTLFTWVHSGNWTRYLRGENCLLWRLRHQIRIYMSDILWELDLLKYKLSRRHCYIHVKYTKIPPSMHFFIYPRHIISNNLSKSANASHSSSCCAPHLIVV